MADLTQLTSLHALAAAQDGVLHREQALSTGVSARVLERLVQNQHWRRLAPGLYFTGATEPGWASLAWGGVLLGGDQARLGGTTAGHLYGLFPEPPPTLTVLIPHDRQREDLACWRFVRERPGVRSNHTRGQPPRLTVEDTVLDLCNEGSESDVVGWVTTAVQRRLTTTARLRIALDRRGRQRHRALLLGLLVDVALGAESSLEIRYLRDVERPHGLPDGSRQKSIRGLRGIRDVLYREWGVIVELDGRLGHAELGRFRDMWRDNETTISNWLTLRYGYLNVVHEPCEVAEQVAEALIRRGWPGLLIRCPRCRRVA